jgi:hypothetical protein
MQISNLSQFDSCHTFKKSSLSTMESDYQDVKPSPQWDQEPSDGMKQLFALLSNQLSSHTTRIQEQIQQNDRRWSISQEQFKNEVRNELDEFPALLAAQNCSKDTPPQVSSTVSTPVTTVRNPSTPCSSTSPPMVNSATSVDLQTQMMLMLTESFSKLSNVLTDSKQDTKTEWHKFSGDVKKFRSWYLGIMANLSLPPWTELYDPIKNDVVLSTTNTTLNGKLYSKVLLSLEGSAYQNFVTRKHLRANGVSLLQELVQTYKPRNVPEIIAAKTVEFWGNTKQNPSESIDAYYDRFQELLKDLSDADEPIAPKAAIRQFIFTLGPELETIQNNFRINNLPEEWKTLNWPQLLTLCRDYYNSVKPHGPSCKPPSIVKDIKDPNFVRDAHQKIVREWFMSPVKFCKKIEAMQCRCPGQCIFHLSKTHSTSACFIKKECNRSVKENVGQLSQSKDTITSGNLHHITDEKVIEDIMEESFVDSLEHSANDTNDDVLAYFTRMSNHYL